MKTKYTETDYFALLNKIKLFILFNKYNKPLTLMYNKYNKLWALINV